MLSRKKLMREEEGGEKPGKERKRIYE